MSLSLHASTQLAIPAQKEAVRYYLQTFCKIFLKQITKQLIDLISLIIAKTMF